MNPRDRLQFLVPHRLQGQDGKDNYPNEIIAETMQLLGGREGGGGGMGGGGDDGGYSRESEERPARSAPAPRSAPQRPAPAPKSSTGFDDMDDDTLGGYGRQLCASDTLLNMPHETFSRPGSCLKTWQKLEMRRNSVQKGRRTQGLVR